MIFPRSPATLSPAARIPVSPVVLTLNTIVRLYGRQAAVDSVFEANVMREAFAAGRSAARALQVGDTFPGANRASIEYYGSDPAGARLPLRARLEHGAFREGFLAALPEVWTGATTEIVMMQRAVPRVHAHDGGGFIVIRQEVRGDWRALPHVYRDAGTAKEAARWRPAARRTAWAERFSIRGLTGAGSRPMSDL